MHEGQIEINVLAPVRFSTALAAAACVPSIMSSKKRSMGSQSAEPLVPWCWLVNAKIEPEERSAWNSPRGIVLLSLSRNLLVWDAKYVRASGLICFEFLTSNDLVVSTLKRWLKSSQWVGLKREKERLEGLIEKDVKKLLHFNYFHQASRVQDKRKK